MTEFQELVKDAPKFVSMERGELVAYAYGMYAACAKMDAENAKLRELAKRMHYQIKQTCDECDGYYCSNFDEDNECCVYDTLLRELGVVGE